MHLLGLQNADVPAIWPSIISTYKKKVTITIECSFAFLWEWVWMPLFTVILPDRSRNNPNTCTEFRSPLGDSPFPTEIGGSCIIDVSLAASHLPIGNPKCSSILLRRGACLYATKARAWVGQWAHVYIPLKKRVDVSLVSLMLVS